MPRKRHPATYDAGRREWSRKQRDTARLEAEDRFYRQLSKEREIGVDPIHHHGSTARKEFSRTAWLKRSREWDQKHG